MEPIESFTPVWIILTSSVAALLIALLGRWPNVRESCIFAAAAITLALLLSLSPGVPAGNLFEFDVVDPNPNAIRHDLLCKWRMVVPSESPRARNPHSTGTLF